MKHFFFLLAVILFSSACSSTKITSDYDKEADFSKYKTFFLLPWSDKNDQRVNSFDKARIYEAVAEEMIARGYTQVEDNGDLAINVLLVLDQKTGMTAYTDYYNSGGWGYGYSAPWGWGAGYATTTYQEYDYVDGTLVVDVFDVASKNLIWQGVASGTVDDNPNNREKRIHKVMYQIFWYYPLKKTRK